METQNTGLMSRLSWKMEKSLLQHDSNRKLEESAKDTGKGRRTWSIGRNILKNSTLEGGAGNGIVMNAAMSSLGSVGKCSM